MVDIYVPFTANVNFTTLEFTKLLEEYRDMLLEINDDPNIPEPNLQCIGYENYKIIKIKDLVARLDENQNTAPPPPPQKLTMTNAKSTDRAFKVVRESLDTGRHPSQRRSSFIPIKTYKIKYLKKVGRLGVGASFGELALLKAQPRAATIKAVTMTELATLNKEQFTNIVGKVEEAQIKKKLDMIQSIPFFSNFSKSLNTKILYHAQEVVVCRHQMLFREGENVNDLFFLIKGELEISK